MGFGLPFLIEKCYLTKSISLIQRNERSGAEEPVNWGVFLVFAKKGDLSLLARQLTSSALRGDRVQYLTIAFESSPIESKETPMFVEVSEDGSVIP